MKKFEGKVVLVTGGRIGIGFGIAQKFKAEGADVITAQRGKDTAFPSIDADFSNTDTAEAVIKETIKLKGRLDVLVNNAGIMFERKVEDMSLDEWNRLMTINLTSPMLLIKYAMPHLRKVKGSIINIGSIEGLGSNPHHAAYSSSKAGLHGLSRAIAVDHSGEGVRCNAVAPGWIDSDLATEYIESMPDPTAFRNKIAGLHPIGRTGKPEDIANLVAWLASDEASFVTGQTYTIDGGRLSKLPLPQ